jgi:hypothetical protein
MTLLRSLLAALVLVLFPSATLAEGAQPFAIAGETIAPGTRADFRIIVPAGVDGATFIPVTVIHGRQAGKVLAMVAGVHGFLDPRCRAAGRADRSGDAFGNAGDRAHRQHQRI